MRVCVYLNGGLRRELAPSPPPIKIGETRGCLVYGNIALTYNLFTNISYAILQPLYCDYYTL